MLRVRQDIRPRTYTLARYHQCGVPRDGIEGGHAFFFWQGRGETIMFHFLKCVLKRDSDAEAHALTVINGNGLALVKEGQQV